MWRRGQAYSADLRARVLAAGGSARTVAERFGVSVSYVIKARQRRDTTGETGARPQRSHTPRLLAPLHDAIAAHVARHPDATLDELRAWLGATHGVSVLLIDSRGIETFQLLSSSANLILVPLILILALGPGRYFETGRSVGSAEEVMEIELVDSVTGCSRRLEKQQYTAANGFSKFSLKINVHLRLRTA